MPACARPCSPGAFREPVDPDAAAHQLDGSASALEQTVGPALEAQGFANPNVTRTYQNPDGTVVWSKTYQ